MKILSTDFGKPISRDDADKLFGPMVELKKHRELAAALENIKYPDVKKAAKTFFTGEESGFVFTKKNLENILSILTGNTCLVLYSGMGTGVKANKATLIGFVYKEEGDNLKIIEASGSANSEVEHPGVIRVSSPNIPQSIAPSDISFDLLK